MIPEDMNQKDFASLMGKIAEMMRIAEEGVLNGSAGLNTAASMFNIYRIARDARDMLAFEATSRDVLQKLGAIDRIVDGVHITEAAANFMRENRLIEAIKEVRNNTDLTLREAKDLVQRIMPDYCPTYVAPAPDWLR